MGYKYSREELLKAAAELAASSGIGSLTFGAVGASLGIIRAVGAYVPCWTVRAHVTAARV